MRIDGHGRYWVFAGDGPPLVYDSTGIFLQATGRIGRGPGEFIRPVDAANIDKDSLLVIDPALGRGTVVGPDLRPSRDIPVIGEFFPLLVLNWSTSVVANGNVPTASGSGFPLHWLAVGENAVSVVRSFGPDSGEVRPHEFPRISQTLAPAITGGFWSADHTRYRVTRWGSDGRRLVTLTRNPSWFSNTTAYGLGSPTEPPPAAITAILEDESGLLWVFARVPARTWRDAWPQTAPNQREFEVRQIALDRMFATMIEVIDPKASRVVTRSRLDQWVVSALPGPRAATYSVDGDGVPYVTVFELGISRR